MHSTFRIFVEYRAARHSQTENEIFVCLCTLLLLYLYNVGCDSVEPSRKCDFLLSLRSPFAIFVLKNNKDSDTKQPASLFIQQ